MANPYRNTGKAGSSPAHFIGTLPKIYKAGKKLYKAFSNTAKQYLKGGKPDKPVSNFKEFHRDGVVYDRDMINKAFKNRFGPDAQPAIRPPQIPGTNMGRADAQVKMREAYRNLRK